MTQVVEPIEAVIISGPRRGEIVRLPNEALPEASDEDIELLNKVLDDLIVALDRVSDEIRMTTESVRERVERL